jgi:hypothetical protein
MAAPINPKGAKSDKQWRNAIQLAVHRLATDGKTKHLDILAARLVKSAAEGDISALREIGDRLDGKPTQAIEVNEGAFDGVSDSQLATLIATAQAAIYAAEGNEGGGDASAKSQSSGGLPTIQ